MGDNAVRGRTFGKWVWKVARDKLPERLQAMGIAAFFQTLSNVALRRELAALMRREVDAYERDGNPDRLAKIGNLLYELNRTYGRSDRHLEEESRRITAEQGGFHQRLCLCAIVHGDSAENDGTPSEGP